MTRDDAGRTPARGAARQRSRRGSAPRAAPSSRWDNTPLYLLTGQPTCCCDTEPTPRGSRLSTRSWELTEEERCAVGWVVQHEQAAGVRLMAELGFDLTWEGPGGGTPLHQAAWLGSARMVRLLLELSPGAAHGSANGRRADDDYRQVVEALLDAGARRDAAVNRWGEPPEALASRRVAALLRRGAAED